jgi:cytochrome c
LEIDVEPQPQQAHNLGFSKSKQSLDGVAPALGATAVALALLTGCVPVKALEAGDAGRGRALYGEDCSACHQVDADAYGPRHRGLLGRRAGSVPGYDYSKALAHAGFTWTETQLDRWLSNPDALVPRQRMEAHVADPQDRADLIAYLKTLSP